MRDETSSRVRQQDYHWMALALAQAQQGVYTTSPNPAVGCVIVREGKLLAASYHQRAGAEHAEALALAQAGEQAHGSDMYVTLEPCFHTGKTPPCVNALLHSGVARVIIASVDPNPRTSSKSIACLREHGIEVIVGVHNDRNRTLNKGFLSSYERKRPWVTSKIAQTLDGKIALDDGRSQWITSEAARQDAHLLRAQSCCILTGSGTVCADNPQFSVRGAAANLCHDRARSVLVAIADRCLRTPVNAQILERKPLIFYHQERAHQAHDVDKKITQLEQKGARCIACHDDSMNSILRCLASEYEVRTVLVEAGSGINTALLEAGLIDEIVWYLSGSIMGVGQGAFAHTIATLDQQTRCSVVDVRTIGIDTRITTRLSRQEL